MENERPLRFKVDRGIRFMTASTPCSSFRAGNRIDRLGGTRLSISRHRTSGRESIGLTNGDRGNGGLGGDGMRSIRPDGCHPPLAGSIGISSLQVRMLYGGFASIVAKKRAPAPASLNAEPICVLASKEREPLVVPTSL